MTGDDIHRLIENGEISPMSLIMAILTSNPIADGVMRLSPGGGIGKLVGFLVYLAFRIVSIPIQAAIGFALVLLRMVSGCGSFADNLQLLAVFPFLALAAVLIFGRGVLSYFGL